MIYNFQHLDSFNLRNIQKKINKMADFKKLNLFFVNISGQTQN